MLSWKDTVKVDNSIEKINIYEYEPHQGTRLNDIGDIRITITNEDQFIHPSRSHLYIEGELEPKAGRSYDVTEDGISLVNNGLIYLFDRVAYTIANKRVEDYNNPGRATTMKGLLTYPRIYPEGMSFLWSIDEHPDIDGNDSFKKRCGYIHQEGNGKFSALIPLSHIFGFCEQYDKVMYGAKHELTLHRTNDDDALHRSDEKESDAEDAADKVKKGKITLTKLSWRMPIVKLSDQSKIKLFSDVQAKTIIPIEFLHRQCESLQLDQNKRQLDWRLSIATGSERPRFVILAFQKNKLDKDTANSAVFDNMCVRNARVEFNGEYYPDHDMNINFKRNQYTVAYQMLIDFYKEVMERESCPVRIRDFKTHYPLFVFDISRQSERVKDSASDIRIKADFDEATCQNCYAYALILSDREVHMQSDGSRMHIIN
jgi:hypothetical protein